MRINWKKTFVVTLDVILAVYLVLVFTSFNKPDETRKRCVKVAINIEDEMTNGFLDASDIKRRLQACKLYPLNKPMAQVNTREIEAMLKRSPFVKTTDCYKTEDGVVHILLTQRMPVVRIKSLNNDDYYLDDQDQVMPNTRYTSDLIIATGHINKAFAKDYVSVLSKCLMASELWRNQIEQINVLPDKGIELVPRVGNHVVYIGQLPESTNAAKRKEEVSAYVEKKMKRLEFFYKYGLSQAGWNKYSYINLEFDNQIICKKVSPHL